MEGIQLQEMDKLQKEIAFGAGAGAGAINDMQKMPAAGIRPTSGPGQIEAIDKVPDD